MIDLIGNEIFKITKKYSTWVFIVIWLTWLFLLPLFPLVTFASVALDFSIINLLLAVIASAIVVEEFTQKTIKFLLTQMHTRTEILFAKFFAVLFVGIMLDAIQFLIAYVATFFSASMQALTLNSLGLLVVVALLLQLLLITIPLLISVILNSKSLAITLSVLLIIFGPLVSGLLGLIFKFNAWKFNPLSLMNVVSLASTNTTEQDLLPLWQYVLGILIYSLFFLMITNFVFTKKEVTT